MWAEAETSKVAYRKTHGPVQHIKQPHSPFLLAREETGRNQASYRPEGSRGRVGGRRGKTGRDVGPA